MAAADRKAALDAIAAGGTAGLAAYQQQRAAMQQSQNEALAGVASDAPWNPPAAATAEMQQMVRVPGDQYLQALDQGATSYAGFMGRQSSALDTYLRQVSAVEPLVRAAAEAKRAEAAESQALYERDQWEQRATLTGEVEKERLKADQERAKAEQERARAIRRARQAEENAGHDMSLQAEGDRMRLQGQNQAYAETKGTDDERMDAYRSIVAQRPELRTNLEVDRKLTGYIGENERRADDYRVTAGRQTDYLEQALAQLAQPDASVAERIAVEKYGYPDVLAAGLSKEWFPEPTLKERYESETGFASPMEQQSWEEALSGISPEEREAADRYGVSVEEYAGLQSLPDYTAAVEDATKFIQDRRGQDLGTTEDHVTELLLYNDPSLAKKPTLLAMILDAVKPFLTSDAYDPIGDEDLGQYVSGG